MDITYLVLVLPAVIFALWAQGYVKRTFKKYSQVGNAGGLTGAEAARRILQMSGIYDVQIEHIAGELTDHYDPKAKKLRLSESTYSSTSVAAVGVAAHEVGHAIQHSEGYSPLTLRNAIIPVTNIGSKLAVPLIILGLLLTTYGEKYIMLAYIGVLCFALSTVFQLLTLPVEFNASHRALNILETSNMLYDKELVGARKTLKAAALTYVAALAVSLMQLLRLLLIVSGGRSRRRR